MDASDLAFLPAVEQMALLEKRAVSSRELLDCYLGRVATLNPPLNAVVTLDAERARRRAAEADDARARGESWGPLHGLPMTVKDVFETEGLRTTAGSPDLAGYVPDQDAIVVRRLRHAGAVIFGKTNTPAMAADGQTYNEVFGTTNNPWDVSRTPGGSSGGCAAAVAAGLTSFSIGSDIAGSVRIPSAFCGLFGHKPTWGLVPQRGHIPGPPGSMIDRDINTIGPLARDVRDLEVALSVIAGPATQEALAWRAPLPPAPDKPLRDYRVALWPDDPFCPVDAAVIERLRAAAQALRDEGAQVDESARPPLRMEESHELFLKLLRPDPARTHQEWLDLDDKRQHLREAWAAFFQRFDILLCPPCSVPPFPHQQGPREERQFIVNGRERPYADFIVWPGLVGVCYLPSTVAPAGLTPEGLPVGVQVVGPHLSDARTLRFAGRLGELMGGFRRPPGY